MRKLRAQPDLKHASNSLGVTLLRNSASLQYNRIINAGLHFLGSFIPGSSNNHRRRWCVSPRIIPRRARSRGEVVLFKESLAPPFFPVTLYFDRQKLD